MGKAKKEATADVVNIDGSDPTVEIVRESFLSAVQSGKQEDDVKLEMIKSGATFKNVARLYNQFMIDAGLSVSKEDRSKAVSDALVGASFATQEDLDRSISILINAIPGTNEKGASGMIRAYAKKNSMECFVKPKGEPSLRTGLISNLYDFIIANPMQSEAELTEYVMRTADEKNSTNFSNHLSSHLGVLKLARRVAEKYGQ